MSEVWSEQYRLAAKDWVAKDSAANLLEETKSSVLSQRMLACGDMPVNRAEMQTKASVEWKEFIASMVKAREEDNLAKVKVEYVRMKFNEWQSAEATRRHEMRL